jgi:hypothetical protein
VPTITRANWSVAYGWSQSSGLRLGVCTYAGIGVVANASVPFVYVNYEGDAAGPRTGDSAELWALRYKQIESWAS